MYLRGSVRVIYILHIKPRTFYTNRLIFSSPQLSTIVLLIVYPVSYQSRTCAVSGSLTCRTYQLPVLKVSRTYSDPL